MNSEPRSILVCDDNVDHLMLVKRALQRHEPGFRVTTVSTAAVCLEQLQKSRFDVVLIDYLLRDMNGIDLMREIKSQYPDILAVMITGMGNEDVAVQAMKSGAADYIIKSAGSFAVVPMVVERALERRVLLESKRLLESQIDESAQAGRPGPLALAMAHDLNELLGAILGRAQLMREQIAPDNSAPLGVIETAARDAAAIVKRFLSSGAGQGIDVSQPLRLASAVRDCLEFTRGRWETAAAAHGITYRIEVAIAEDLTVEVPAAALREVITNLIVNALQAMPEGGALVLRGREEAGDAQLVIQDTGVGMSPQLLSRLFVSRVATEKTEGHGLGLANCRLLLEQMGGRISVESELDVGSSFTVTLPRAAAPPDRAGHGAGSSAPTGLRVLVVDDEPRVAGLFEDILRLDGQSVEVACSGEEAMSKFEPGHCDVVFCDLSLPGMGGLAVARAMRAIDPAVAIVLVSGWSRDVLADDIDHQVFDLSAEKPLDLEQVRDLIDRAGRLATGRRIR